MSPRVPRGKQPKPIGITAAKLAPVKVPKTEDRYAQEVKTEQRRTTGVTPRLLGMFPESPARMLPRARGLRGLAKPSASRGASVL